MEEFECPSEESFDRGCPRKVGQHSMLVLLSADAKSVIETSSQLSIESLSRDIEHRVKVTHSQFVFVFFAYSRCG